MRGGYAVLQPWLEAHFPDGLQSNCVTCHQRAVVGAADYLPVTQGRLKSDDPYFAVDDDERRAIGRETTVPQIGEQRRARRGVLGRAIANAEHVLVAVGIDAERNEHHMLVDVHAIDHQHAVERPVERTRDCRCA